jgi:hypothetical protein
LELETALTDSIANAAVDRQAHNLKVVGSNAIPADQLDFKCIIGGGPKRHLIDQ